MQASFQDYKHHFSFALSCGNCSADRGCMFVQCEKRDLRFAGKKQNLCVLLPPTPLVLWQRNREMN